MRADLMTFIDGSLDPGCFGWVVDVPEVLTIHEKGSLDAVVSQNIQDLVGIDVGAIIKCDGKRSRHGALSDNLPHGNGRDADVIRNSHRLLPINRRVCRERVDGKHQGRDGCELEELHG